MFTRKLLLILSLFVLAQGGILFSQTRIIPYQELPDPSGLPSGSGMFFSASISPATITLTFEGPADRWIALGFGTAMISTDVLVYSCGHAMSVHPPGWYDYYNSSHNNSGVLVDVNQNWTILSTGLVSGQRTVTATRVLNTGDVNDTPFSFAAPALSLVWARGASPDYTIAYHGGNNRAHGISLPWLSAPIASFAPVSTSVCAGSALSFSNLSTGGLTSYTWSFPGGMPSSSTSTNPAVVYPLSGNYPVLLTASNSIGTNTYAHTFSITVTPTLVPAITIQQIAGSNPLCAGAPVSFSAITSNGGSSPVFSWKTNNVTTGANSPLFSTSTLTNSSLITCQLHSSLACATPSFVTSAALNMTVHPTDPAGVSISITGGSNPMCTGDPITFSATPNQGGSAPSYQWRINGNPTGPNNSLFTMSSPGHNDLVDCVLSSNAPCASSTLATSAAITLTVSPVLTPSVYIAPVSSHSIFCEGSPVTVTATALNGGTSPSYQWLFNGQTGGSNSAVFTSIAVIGTHSISCTLTSALSCANPATVSASGILVEVISCTGLSETVSPENEVHVFPNPGSGAFTVNSGSGKISALNIYDATGHLVLRKITEPAAALTFDLSGKPAGIYLLQVSLEEKTLRTHIIKAD